MFQKIGYLIFASVLLVSYQNCSMQSTHKGAQDTSSLSKTCDNALAVTYKETYYASFRTNCTSCHDAGGESGRPFASANFNESWNSFKSIGRQKIENNAVSASHKAPRTGPQHQALIDGAQAKWRAAEDLAATCQQGMEIQTIKKALPAAVYTGNPPANNAAWPRLSFNLMTEVANGGLMNKIQLTVSVEVRRYIPAGQTVAAAYEFKNPRVTVTGTAPLPSYRIMGLKILRNDMINNDFTFFQNIDVVVNSGTETLIQSGGNWAAYWAVPANTDQFAIKFLEIRDGSGLPITGTPVGPGPGTPTLPTRVSYNELAGAQQALNVFTRRCFSCHGAGGAGGLNMTTYANAQAAAQLIQARMNNFANPMPPSGALAADERALVDIWISSGTPQQ